MHVQKNKPKENLGKISVNALTQKKSAAKQGFEFVNNRTKTVAQKHMTAMRNNTSYRQNDQGETIQRLLIHTGDAAIGNDGTGGYRTGGKNLISAGELQEQMLSLKEKYGDDSVDVSELKGEGFAEKNRWDPRINYLLGHFEPDRDFFLGVTIDGLSDKLKESGLPKGSILVILACQGEKIGKALASKLSDWNVKTVSTPDLAFETYDTVTGTETEETFKPTARDDEGDAARDKIAQAFEILRFKNMLQSVLPGLERKGNNHKYVQADKNFLNNKIKINIKHEKYFAKDYDLKNGRYFKTQDEQEKYAGVKTSEVSGEKNLDTLRRSGKSVDGVYGYDKIGSGDIISANDYTNKWSPEIIFKDPVPRDTGALLSALNKAIQVQQIDVIEGIHGMIDYAKLKEPNLNAAIFDMFHIINAAHDYISFVIRNMKSKKLEGKGWKMYEKDNLIDANKHWRDFEDIVLILKEKTVSKKKDDTVSGEVVESIEDLLLKIGIIKDSLNRGVLVGPVHNSE